MRQHPRGRTGTLLQHPQPSTTSQHPAADTATQVSAFAPRVSALLGHPCRIQNVDPGRHTACGRHGNPYRTAAYPSGALDHPCSAGRGAARHACQWPRPLPPSALRARSAICIRAFARRARGPGARAMRRDPPSTDGGGHCGNHVTVNRSSKVGLSMPRRTDYGFHQNVHLQAVFFLFLSDVGRTWLAGRLARPFQMRAYAQQSRAVP